MFFHMILAVVMILLVVFDVVKVTAHPNKVISILKDTTNPTNETDSVASLFFISPILSGCMFLSMPLLIKFNIVDDDNMYLKKILLAAIYIVTAVIIVVVEISTSWYGFADSQIWVLVGWVGTMSPFGFRGSFCVSTVIVALYSICLILGVGMSVLSASTIQKLWQLAVLLYIPNFLVAVFIEEQIEQAARLTVKEEDGLEELEEQLTYGKNLLETVLPKELITMVKQMSEVKDAAIAHKYESCTITFIKIVGIHALFESKPTVTVMETVDKLYRKIDGLTNRHLVEKIKTVGDVYMAASGLPRPNNKHAIIIADFCFDVAESVVNYSSKKGIALSFQIGVSSGAVVAGVIGKNKYTYDLWGDAANVASRMYSFGKKGKIMTTIDTVKLIDKFYRCTEGGIKEIKGKGKMPVYFVDGRLPTYPMSMRASTTAEQDNLEEKYLSRGKEGKKNDDQFAQRLKDGSTDGVGRAAWIPDSHFTACMECEKPFTLTFRRHHCRYCGRLLCHECTTRKVYKERCCDKCFDTWNDEVQRNVFLRKAKLRRVADKTGKAQHNFESPYRSMYHCCRSGTSRALEYEYLVKKKQTVRTLLLFSWFAVLFTMVIANHVINDFLLPFRCVNATNGKSSDCDKFDVPTIEGYKGIEGEGEGGATTYGTVGHQVMYTSQTKKSFGKVDAKKGIYQIDSTQKMEIEKGIDLLYAAHGINVTTDDGKPLAKIESITEYFLPFLGLFDDNVVVSVAYGSRSINKTTGKLSDHAGARAEYSIEQLMYAKTIFAFGIIPLLMCTILVSMQDYNISTNKEFVKHMSVEITRDPGKPAPGKYTVADQKWIA